MMRFIATLLLAACSALHALPDELPDTLAAGALDEVVVTGLSARQRLEAVTPGVEKIELSKMAVLPVVFGENDIIKSIALLPGVRNESDGAGGFEVRGGNASQNLVMLDGITLYNPAHMMGIFSTFNDQALGRATLYKGPVPAAWGSATSAVLDATLSRGDMERFHAAATVGLLMAKLKVEGPVVRNKLSFAVTGRRSYADLFMKCVPRYRDIVMNFYDVTAKLSYAPRRGQYIDVSFFRSRDNMAIPYVMGMYWGNTGVAANWLAYHGKRWRFATTAAFTSYAPEMTSTIMRSDQRLREYIRNLSLNWQADFSIAEHHVLSFGVRSALLRVKSGDMQVNATRELEIRSGWENALWAVYEGRLLDCLELSAGVRLGLFSALSGRRFHDFSSLQGPAPDFGGRTYVTPQPRVSLKYSLTPLHSIKAGASATAQAIHAIRSTFTSFPFDRYALTSATVAPEKALQYVAGYFGMTERGDFDWSAEAYYRTIRNVYDYRDGRTMYSDINLESIILGGRGRSCGVELMVRKNSGRLTGWIAYTLSKTMTRIPGINGGRWYDAGNDRRNDLSVTATYSLTDSWTLSGVFTFMSGQPLTVPDAKYEIDGITCYYYSQRNGYRTPPSHHLDLSALYTRRGRRLTWQLAFGVYNLYNHYSPFVVYFTDDPTKPSGTKAVQQSLYGIVPSVSFTLKL